MNYLEEYISKFYKSIDIHSSEQLNNEQIAHKLQIGLYYWNNRSQDIVIHNKPFIFLEATMLPNFVWQTFCHELGHILLHVGDQMKLPESFVKYQECKANNFALHAAIPTFMLHELNLPADYFEAVRLIQETFHVSLSFACKRLDHYINNHIAPLHTMAQ